MIETFISILEYLVIYSIPISLFYLADIAKKRSSQKRFIVAGVIFLSLVSGLRSLEIGSDTRNTILLYFDNANVQGSGSLFQSVNDATVYYLIAGLVKALRLGSAGMLFVLQMLSILPMAIVAYNRKEHTSMALTMAIYLILYFQLSFNWIRQSIAVSFVLLAATCYQQDRKVVKLVLLLITAILFHSSAILGIVIYAIAHFFTKLKNKYIRSFLVVFIVAFLFVFMKEWKNLSLWMIEKGLLPYSYMGYVNVFSGGHGDSFRGWFLIGKLTYVEYMFRVVFFVVPFLLLKHKKKRIILQSEQHIADFYSAVAFFSILIYSMAFWGLHTAYGNRITYYLDIANPLYFGLVSLKPRKKHRMRIGLTNLILVMLCVAYNFLLYYLMGWHATVPYRFFF